MELHALSSPRGSRKRRKIVGRGRGSGHGKTSGRGEDGQLTRSGKGPLLQLEGGQMHLIRRLPKMGFRKPNPNYYQPINVGRLEHFGKGSVVNAASLRAARMIHGYNQPFKILGTGILTKPLTVQAQHISQAAKDKILKAGGKVEEVKNESSAGK
ncbi:MAG: 50S ribosomal protein L15 [Candidatus Omnitrophica bacterium]|nr:50S ribosomal protein L15 [Candidatus Omnitrophota bacterium]